MLPLLGYRISALIRSGIVAGISSLAILGMVETAQAVSITKEFTIQGFTLDGTDADNNSISGVTGGQLFVSFTGEDTDNNDLLDFSEFSFFETESFGFSEPEANFILDALSVDIFSATYDILTETFTFTLAEQIGAGLKLHSFEEGSAEVTINDPLVGLDYDLALTASTSNATVTPGIDRPIPWQTDVATGSSALLMAGLAYNRFRKKTSA